MDEIAFHREPPTNLPTMVVAFGGWVDAGEAATGAMRYLVRQLAAAPLASIDPEDFCDFTQIRPVVRLSAEGQRLIRWPRCAFWTWQPPEGRAGLLLFRGMEPQRRWLTYATLRGQAPHYLGGAPNPAVSRALLTTVAHLLDLELDVAPFEVAVRAFRTQCDQAVAQDAAVQAYVRQLEQDYDAPGDETPHPRRDDDFNPEQLMHDLEDFLRQERERGAE